MSADLLFRDDDLRLTLEAIAHKMVDEINAAPEQHLLQVDEDRWVSALVERWSVEAPELHPDKMWMDRPQEIQVDVRGHPNRAIFDHSRPVLWPGYRVTVHVPFSGDDGRRARLRDADGHASRVGRLRG
jgi:hypothetical protein